MTTATPESRGENLRSWITVLVSIGTIILAAFVNHKQNQVQDKQAALGDAQQELAEGQSDLARQVAEADRFSALSGQIASGEAIERIAGLYGLVDLAEDEPVTQVRVLLVLASYLRSGPEAGEAGPNETAVAAGTLRNVTRMIGNGGDDGTDLAYDLAYVQLPDYDLSELRAHRAYFYSVDFSLSNLQGAVITCTDLTGADLREAQLEGAQLDRVLLEGADLADVSVDEGTRLGAIYWTDDPPTLPTDLTRARAGTVDDFNRECR